MKGETELGVPDEREEPVGAVAGPLHEDGRASALDLGLDEGRPFPDDPDGVAAGFENLPVGVPGGTDGLLAVVEEVEVARDTLAAEDLVERCSAGHVARTGCGADPG